MKYLLTCEVPFEAIDDVDARKEAFLRLRSIFGDFISWDELDLARFEVGAGIRLRRIYEDQPPTSVTIS